MTNRTGSIQYPWVMQLEGPMEVRSAGCTYLWPGAHGLCAREMAAKMLPCRVVPKTQIAKSSSLSRTARPTTTLQRTHIGYRRFTYANMWGAVHSVHGRSPCLMCATSPNFRPQVSESPVRSAPNLHVALRCIVCEFGTPCFTCEPYLLAI